MQTLDHRGLSDLKSDELRQRARDQLTLEAKRQGHVNVVIDYDRKAACHHSHRRMPVRTSH
jgi:hypothetical protein